MPRKHDFLHMNRLFYVHVKGPQNRPLFSERCGYNPPLIRVAGWRLFIGRTQS